MACVVLLIAGEEPHSGIVASITSGNPALVTCVDDERLEFQVGSSCGSTSNGGYGSRQIQCTLQGLLAASCVPCSK